MSKLIGMACGVMLLLLSAPQNEHFAKYKVVEVYEVRPGILLMPSYTEDGQVCKVGLETRHYSPELVRLDSELSRKMIDQITDELAPPAERGPRSKDFSRDVITIVGPGMTTSVIYENVSIQIYSRVLPSSKKHETAVNNVAANVIWTHRKCQ